MRENKVSAVTRGLGTKAENGSHREGGRPVMRFVRYVGGKLKTSFAVFGVVAAAGLYYEYKTVFPGLDDDGSDEKKKKKVLVVPFNRIELKDKHDRDFSFDRFSPNSEDRTLKFEVRELVDLLHHAASDPSIVALYGTFGHGSVLSQVGWADLEEVRNALKVFREAHRTHSEVRRLVCPLFPSYYSQKLTLLHFF
jgi:hypothetical protein